MEEVCEVGPENLRQNFWIKEISPLFSGVEKVELCQHQNQILRSYFEHLLM